MVPVACIAWPDFNIAHKLSMHNRTFPLRFEQNTAIPWVEYDFVEGMSPMTFLGCFHQINKVCVSHSKIDT